MFGAIFSLEALRWLMWILYIPSCIGLIVIVLLQKGKGTGFAGAFGMGPGSDAVFGPRARKSLPVKMTYGMAALFIILALGLSVVEGRVARGRAPEFVEDDVIVAEPSQLEGLGEAYEDEEELELTPDELDRTIEDVPAEELPDEAVPPVPDVDQSLETPFETPLVTPEEPSDDAEDESLEDTAEPEDDAGGDEE